MHYRHRQRCLKRTIPTPARITNGLGDLHAAGLCCSTNGRPGCHPQCQGSEGRACAPFQAQCSIVSFADAFHMLSHLYALFYRILSDSGNGLAMVQWSGSQDSDRLKAQALSGRQAQSLVAQLHSLFRAVFWAGRRGRESPDRPDSIDSTPINVYIYIYRAKKLQGLWRKLDGSTLASWTSARTAARRILWLLDVTPGNLRARARAITHDIPS